MVLIFVASQPTLIDLRFAVSYEQMLNILSKRLRSISD